MVPANKFLLWRSGNYIRKYTNLRAQHKQRFIIMDSQLQTEKKTALKLLSD